MNIIYKKLQELKPYEKNPRRNDEAVEYVTNSIKEFGFKNPIILDKNNVIVAGHTRYKAAKKLKLKEVPCIIADDLTEEQIKAFRLADNKTSEIAEWDFDLLSEELENILDIDMADFGFDLNFDEIDPKEEWKGMPEFEQENAEGCQKIVVHFKTLQDVKDFSELINQKITDKTKSIWFPEEKNEKLKDMAYE